MRPNHDEWSCNTAQGLYPERSLLKPCADLQYVNAVKIGPLVRGDSQGSLNNRWWLCYQDGNSVLMRGAVDTVYWSAAVEIFTETDTISRIDFTFDQVGREIIFYQVGTELRLWYFDPIAAAYIKRVIDTDASQPTCGFDLINDTSDPMSDAHLFYVKDDIILERLQRDRYDIVYDTNIGYPDIIIASCGMTDGNTFQVHYVVPDTTMDLSRGKVYQTAGPILTNFNTDVFEIGFEIGRNYNSRCVERDINGEAYLTLFEHSSFGEALVDTTINVSLLYPQIEFGEFPLISVSASNLSSPLAYFQLDDHLYKGVYRFLFSDGTTSDKKQCVVYRDGSIIADFEMDKPTLSAPSVSTHTLKFGAADEPTAPTELVYWRCTKALFLNMYAIVNDIRTDWPVTTGIPVTTPSVPPGNTMTVYFDGVNGVRVV